jgi:quercetin dioxygenase-like cupin family protein
VKPTVMNTRRAILVAFGGLTGLLRPGVGGAQTPGSAVEERHGICRLHEPALRNLAQDQKSISRGRCELTRFPVREPSRVSAGSVTFEPGARTAWHTHPLGQTLLITSGFGWVQREGGPIEEVHPGDVVWFPAGLKHWHGATPTNDDAYRHSGNSERKERGLDGKGQRRTISQVKTANS